jgi:transposase
MHVTSTPGLTQYQVHASRGKPALEAIGILPRFTGTSVHDGWSSYFLYPCAHATCNVHLLRDLTYLAEEQGLWWAAKLKRLLLKMKAVTEELRERGRLWLDPMEVADWQARFLALLAEAEVVHPRAQAPPGHRGRVKQRSARNLLDRLHTHQQAVWAFLEDLRVPFDNNLAERDLRMVKVQQKVSDTSARGRAHRPLRVFGATCPPCANKACRCFLPCRPLCLANLFSLLFSRPKQLLHNTNITFLVDNLHSFQ